MERQVLAIDHAFEKTQPLRQEILRFRIDQNLAAVERNGRFGAVEPEFFGILLRGKQQRMNRQRRVGAEMQAQARFVRSMGLEFVELDVLLLLDFVLISQPERLDGVDALAR